MSITSGARGNGKKKLIFIGNTGVGKSSLCNVFSGKPKDSDLFPVSSAAESCTQNVRIADSSFNGQPGRDITIIDTIGLMDGARDDDSHIIKDLKDCLQKNCDHINLFLIALNGAQPRFDSGLIQMFTLFETMFGKKFWNQCLVVFTHLRMNSTYISDRQEDNQKSDSEKARDFIQSIAKKFPESNGLKYVFIDAYRRSENPEEEEAFQSGMETVWNCLIKAEPLSTDRISDAETEVREMQRQLEDQANDRRLQWGRLVVDGSNSLRQWFPPSTQPQTNINVSLGGLLSPLDLANPANPSPSASSGSRSFSTDPFSSIPLSARIQLMQSYEEIQRLRSLNGNQ